MKEFSILLVFIFVISIFTSCKELQIVKKSEIYQNESVSNVELFCFCYDPEKICLPKHIYLEDIIDNDILLFSSEESSQSLYNYLSEIIINNRNGQSIDIDLLDHRVVFRFQTDSSMIHFSMFNRDKIILIETGKMVDVPKDFFKKMKEFIGREMKC